MLLPVSALVVIDTQRGLLDGEAAIPNSEVVLDRLAIILAAAVIDDTVFVSQGIEIVRTPP